MPSIEVRGVTKSYPAGESRRAMLGWLAGRRAADRVFALKDISFTADAGEIVGLVGPNGSGKSTLLRILATLEQADAGEVVVGGLDLSEHGAEVRRKTGVVPAEDCGFELRATLRENLEFYGALCGRQVGRPDIYYALDAMGLAVLADDLAGTLGSGQLRRLSLSRALLGDPRVLLLDEPARSVDAEFAARIADVIRHAAHSRGATVMLVSHSPEEVRNLCDRSLLLDRGRLLHVTAPRKPAQPAHSAVRR